MQKSQKKHTRTPSINVLLSERSRKSLQGQETKVNLHESLKEDRIKNLRIKQQELKIVLKDTTHENEDLKSANNTLKQRLNNINQDLSQFFMEFQRKIKPSPVKDKKRNSAQIFPNKHNQQRKQPPQIQSPQSEFQKHRVNRASEDVQSRKKPTKRQTELNLPSTYLNTIPTLRSPNQVQSSKRSKRDHKVEIKKTFMNKNTQEKKKQHSQKLLIKQSIDKMWQKSSKTQQTPLIERLYKFQNRENHQKASGLYTPITFDCTNFSSLLTSKMLSFGSMKDVWSQKSYLSSGSPKFH